MGHSLIAMLVVLLGGGMKAYAHDNDDFQKRINEQAYRNRFNREPFPDEKTGIKVSKEIPTAAGAEPYVRSDMKMVLMTGDDSISAFDNARKKLFEMFSKDYGVREGIQLSRDANEQVGDVRSTSISNLESALKDLSVGSYEGCLIHMTSHGTQSGFYIKGQDYLTPDKLNQLIKDACGENPTVLLVSACYSGIFAEPKMEAPNRIILTAARKDRTSFGCSAEAVYTYWDGCLVTTLPTVSTWFELAGAMEKCIEAKESGGGFARSYPQARFGALVKDLVISQKVMTIPFPIP